MSRARATSGGPRSGARGASGSRRGAAPTGLVVAAAALGLALGVGALVRDARTRGFTDIDTRRVAVQGEGRVPAAWGAWLAERLVELGRLDVEDEAGLAALRDEIAAAPFVARVGEGRALWPDGYELDVRLRVPVACIRSGEDFLAVDAEGVVLPGRRTAPPDRGRGPLPVVGPNDGALDGLLPGDRLPEARHFDALSVALSLDEHLGATERRRLGPALIDATFGGSASVEEPGVRIDLEGRRRLLFGRPPSAGRPGELPPAEKWAHVARLLATMEREPELDWELLDLRWDRAVLVERGAAPERAAEAERPRAPEPSSSGGARSWRPR